MIVSNQPLLFEHDHLTKGIYRLVKRRIRYVEKTKKVPIDDCLRWLRHYHEMIDICDEAIIFGCKTLGIDYDDLITQSSAAYNH